LDPGPLALTMFLRRYIVKHRIGLVHIFDTGQSLVTALAARSCPGVRLLSSQRFLMDPVPRKHRYMLLAAHWLSDGVVANSENVRRYLNERYYYPLSRLQVCHNGVDSQVFSPEGRVRLPALKNASLVVGSVAVL